MPKAADILAQRLHEAGCRTAFGIPGGEVLAMMDALNRAGLRMVLPKHENAGGFMAEGSWHATGAPGILLATLGPGVANGINVVANAWQDRVPLIFLTGCVDAHEAETYTHQVFDHTKLLAPITKASIRLAPGSVAVQVDKALAIALDGQPGPVHLDMPISLANAEEVDPAPRRPMPAPMAPAPSDIFADAKAKLAAAERPLVIAGVDVLTQYGEDKVRELVEAHQLPIITSYKAKGIVDEASPLCLGGHGLSPKSDGMILPLIAKADVVLLVGYDPIEMRTGWRNPFAVGQTVIELSAVPNTHYMHLATHSFVGDVAASLEALLDGTTLESPLWPDGEPAQTRSALKQAFTPMSDWGPATVFDTIRKSTPPETVVTVDSGAHRILVSQMWPCSNPRSMLQSTALCTMGCAVPLASGFRLTDGKARPTIAFVGDAGLEMILGELATLRDLAIPVIVVVLVDRSLALIEKKQRSSGLENVAVDFGWTDFASVAEALGGRGVGVKDRPALETAIAEALDETKRFTVIAAEIDRKAYDGTF